MTVCTAKNYIPMSHLVLRTTIAAINSARYHVTPKRLVYSKEHVIKTRAFSVRTAPSGLRVPLSINQRWLPPNWHLCVYRLDEKNTKCRCFNIVSNKPIDSGFKNAKGHYILIKIYIFMCWLRSINYTQGLNNFFINRTDNMLQRIAILW